jgi:hypothetical protein
MPLTKLGSRYRLVQGADLEPTGAQQYPGDSCKEFTLLNAKAIAC